MAETAEKLDHFLSLIMKDAEAESEQLLKDFASQKERALESADDEILSEMYQLIKRESLSIRTDAGRRISKRMLDNKRVLYNRRGEIAGMVFDQARQKIEAFTKSPEYAEILSDRLKQAAEAFKDAPDIVVYLRTEDMPLADTLGKAVPGVSLTFKEGSIGLGGLIVDSVSHRLRMDESFDTAFSDLNGHFAELFGFNLTDDK